MSSDAPPPPDATPSPGSPAPSRQVRGRKRRIARWCLRVLIGVPLLLIAISLVLANSPLVGSMVKSELESATGCTVLFDRARIDLDGRVEVVNLRLLVPGVSGPEGQLLLAQRAEVDLSWGAALSMRGWKAIRPTSIRLSKPTFRLSQSLDDGTLNIADVAARRSGAGTSGPGGSSSASARLLPTVHVSDATIEFAEHSTRRALFDVLNTIHVAGAFTNTADGSYRVRMQEIGRLPPPSIDGEAAMPRGMILDGRVDLQRGEAMLRLLNLPLEAWPPESVPTAFRDVWRRLRIQGRIRESVFTYDRENGVKLTVSPENVAMGIPVPDDAAESVNDLSLTAVNGQFTFSREGLAAELEGVLEEQTQPVHVKFKTEGAALDAPLVCEIWGEGLTLARNPGFLPYIPPKAREFFVFFSGPTGIVDAHVTIARGSPIDGKPARVVVTDGRLTVRNGTAAFHLFPYPFHNMEVRATFDENHLNILDIRGDGPTGAKLSASSQAAPMDDDARVDVSVHVSGVPVDQHLRNAMPGSRKQLIEVLFNEQRYNEIVAAGLVRTPNSPQAPTTVPEFALGGICEIDVTVLRPLGPVDDWRTDIVVKFEQAGIVPKPFPFPIVARNVEIRISDEEGSLTRGTFTGLRGGRADLSAHVQLDEDGKNVLKPRLEIAAFDVPVDDLLINAVPDDSTGDADAISAKGILRRLEVQGNVDCSASIRHADNRPDNIDYDVLVSLKGIEARPRPEHADLADQSRLVVNEATGRIRVTRDFVRVEDLTGRLVAEDPRKPADALDATVASCGEFKVSLNAQVLPESPPPEAGPPSPMPIGAIDVTLDTTALNLAAPLPTLLGVFSAEIAETISTVCAHRLPEGRLDAHVQLERAAGQNRPSVVADFSNLKDVSFDILNSRVRLIDPVGAARFSGRDDPDPRRRSSIAFQDFTAGIEYAGQPAGSIDLNGGLSIDASSADAAPIEQRIADADLAVRLRDARFESALMSDLLAYVVSPDTHRSWEEFKVAGVFDAHLDVIGDSAVISGLLGPREVSFERHGRRSELEAMVGHVSFRTISDASAAGRKIQGRIENLGARTPVWNAELNGDWSFIPGQGFSLQTNVAAEGSAISDDLLALLPAAAATAVREVELEVASGFSMPAATLTASIPDTQTEAGDDAKAESETRFDGRVRFAGLSAAIGVPLRECDGEAHIQVAAIGDRPADLKIHCESPSMSIAGLAITDAEALLASIETTDPAEDAGVALSYFTANCHGGRVWGTGRVGGENARTRARDFDVNVLAAGVLFAPLLDELSGPNASEPAGPPRRANSAEPGTPHEPIVGEPDRTRGQADLWVTLTGTIGDPASRVGRGAIRVANGDVLRLPVVFPLVQMSNFMLPSSDSFGYLQAQFHIRGPTAYFEQIAVLSDTVSLMGDGTATLPDLALDMRFNSRSNKRIPLLSDMYEALRDELVTTRVRGTVAQPDIRSETLTTTRTILDTIFDPGTDQRGSIGSDSGARRERTRVGESLRADPPLPPTTLPSRPTGVEG